MRVEESKLAEAAISTEARKGYGILFIGREPASEANRFHEQITRTVAAFARPFAIVIARGEHRQRIDTRLNILVPVSGTEASRNGAELAILLAQASRGSVTALYVSGRPRERQPWRDRFGAVLPPDGSAGAIVQDIVEIGDVYGVGVERDRNRICSRAGRSHARPSLVRRMSNGYQSSGPRKLRYRKPLPQ